MNEETQNNLPYTIVGHTSLPQPRFSMLLTAEGIKELANRMKKEDKCRITIWEDSNDENQSKKYFQKITIVK